MRSCGYDPLPWYTTVSSVHVADTFIDSSLNYTAREWEAKTGQRPQLGCTYSDGMWTMGKEIGK